LIAAALAELARTQWLNAPDAGQNADTPGMSATVRNTDAGYAYAKS